MEAAAGLDTVFILLFCTLCGPADAKEFAVDAYGPRDRSLTAILVRTENGFDLYSERDGERRKEYSLVAPKDHPFLYSLQEKGRQPAGEIDLAETAKSIKPFDSNPVQQFKIKDSVIEVKADGKTRVVRFVGREGFAFVVRPLDVPATRPPGMVTSQPASGPSTRPAASVQQPRSSTQPASQGF